LFAYRWRRSNTA